MDLTQIAINQLLEDFQKKPIKITIENLSNKYIVVGTFQTFKKEKKHGKKHISKGRRSDKAGKNAKVVKRDSPDITNFA